MASRRDFLQAGGCFAAALTAGLGLTGPLAGLPVREIEGSGGATGRSYPIPAGDSVNIDRQVQVILVRFQDVIYAFSLACPHQQAAVKWLPRDHRFQCTKHDSRYSPVGIYESGRATRNLDRFAIALEAAQVSVNLTRWYQSDKDPSGWAAAAVRV